MSTLSADQILRAFIDALAESKRQEISKLWPGTVITYDPGLNTGQIKVDGSMNSVAMVSHIGALTPGQRVTVQFDPPHGAYVVGNGTTGGTGGGGTVGGGLTIEDVQDNLANDFLKPGSQITLVYDDDGNTLTIGSTALTQEQIEDFLGTDFIVQGQNIRIAYNDALNHLTFSVTQLDSALDANGHTITNLPTPTNPGDAASKAYVDAHTSTSDLNFPFFMGT